MSEESVLRRPYVHLLEGRDPVQVMRETPGRLSDVLNRLSTEQIEHKPGEHKWSVREILCHMADCELAWGWRLRLIYGSDKPGAENPHLQPFEQDAWARAYDGGAYTTSAARATWSALRQWNLALIDKTTEADRRRPALHPELGEVTFWTVVEIAAGHDLHHLRSLEKLAS
jgi:uncharacterized damage-inducible protein DinB